MNTVLYIDIARNKKKLIRLFVCVTASLLACFVLSLIIDMVVPSFNEHFNFSKAVNSFLTYYTWHEHLYANVWSLLVFIYPFIHVYVLMEGFACSIVEEEEFETLAYMRNLGIGREVIFVTKLIIRAAFSFALCLAMFIENMIFFLLLNEKKMILAAGSFSIELFLVGLLYLGIAFFIASCSVRESSCSRVCFLVVLIQFIIVRLYAYIRLLADGLFAYGKTYNEIEWMYGISKKFETLKILCPIFMCYPGQKTSVAACIFTALVGIAFFVAGYSIYTRDKVVFRNQ